MESAGRFAEATDSDRAKRSFGPPAGFVPMLLPWTKFPVVPTPVIKMPSRLLAEMIFPVPIPALELAGVDRVDFEQRLRGVSCKPRTKAGSGHCVPLIARPAGVQSERI